NHASFIYAEGKHTGGHKMLMVSGSSMTGSENSATVARARCGRASGGHIDHKAATKFWHSDCVFAVPASPAVVGVCPGEMLRMRSATISCGDLADEHRCEFFAVSTR